MNLHILHKSQMALIGLISRLLLDLGPTSTYMVMVRATIKCRAVTQGDNHNG